MAMYTVCESGGVLPTNETKKVRLDAFCETCGKISRIINRGDTIPSYVTCPICDAKIKVKDIVIIQSIHTPVNIDRAYVTWLCDNCGYKHVRHDTKPIYNCANCGSKRIHVISNTPEDKQATHVEDKQTKHADLNRDNNIISIW